MEHNPKKRESSELDIDPRVERRLFELRGCLSDASTLLDDIWRCGNLTIKEITSWIERTKEIEENYQSALEVLNALRAVLEREKGEGSPEVVLIDENLKMSSVRWKAFSVQIQVLDSLTENPRSRPLRESYYIEDPDISRDASPTQTLVDSKFSNFFGINEELQKLFNTKRAYKADLASRKLSDDERDKRTTEIKALDARINALIAKRVSIEVEIYKILDRYGGENSFLLSNYGQGTLH